MDATLMVTPHGDDERWTVNRGRSQNEGLAFGYAPTGLGGYGIHALCGKPINADLIAAVMNEKSLGVDFSSSTPRPWTYRDRDGGVVVGADGVVVVQGMPETTARRVIAAVRTYDAR